MKAVAEALRKSAVYRAVEKEKDFKALKKEPEIFATIDRFAACCYERKRES